MNIKIRKEKKADFLDVHRLSQSAFGQDNESKLIDLLRKLEAFIPNLSLVASVDSKVVGHILFSKIKIIDDAGNAHESLALAPMAVDPAVQRRGIGNELIRHGLDKARKLGHRSVIVLGHEHYYPKFGFIPAVNWKIKAPFDVPENILMGVEDGLKELTGTVHYPKEFVVV
jgi:putative acetyltransferase